MSYKTKLVRGFVGIALAVTMLVGVGTANAAALTTDQVNAIISLLQSFGADSTTISNVQASLTGGTPAPAPGPSTGFVFARDLKMGDTGTDVMNLQKVLNSDSATMVASSGVGSAGNETTYFGGLTKTAVIKFQNKYASEVLTPVGLAVGTGYVGPSTRAKLNSMGGGTVTPPGGTVTPPPAVGTGLSVTDPGQPGASLAPQSAARVPFTKVRVTAGNDGDVTINSVVVERTGLGQNAVFAGVVLLDENGMQLGDAKTFNSNNQATIGEAVTIKSGTSRILTVAGNMASDLSSYAGQVVSLTVKGINANGATVSGSLPITGAGHTINASLSLGSVTTAVSSYDPNTSASKEIGTTDYKFAGINVTAGSAEKVRIWSIRWNQTGSVGSSDLANVKTYVDGVAYATTLSADSKYYTTVFPGGILIDKGLAKDIWVQADIIGSNASGRTAIFDIYKTTDLYITGETYGYGITPPAGSGTASADDSAFTAGTPWFDGSTVTITAGSATSINKATSVAAQNIAVNIPNQVLGGFETDIKGEPLTVQQIVITVATTSGSGSGLLTNVSLVDQNGAVVAGPVDASGAGTSLTFTDTVTIPVGKSVYTVKGKVASGIGNGTVYTLSMTPSSQWTNVTGQVTGNTITLTNGAFSMNPMTVKAAALTISVSTSPAAQNIVTGGNILFTNYQLDASQSGEDVRFGAIPLAYNQAANAKAAAPSKLTNCQLFDGDTALNTGSNVVNPSTTSTTTTPMAQTVTLDSQYTVPKGTVKSLAWKCTVSTGSHDSSVFAWGLTNGVSMTVTGVDSGAAVSESLTQANGSNMTVATGSFTVAIDSSTSSYKTVSAGSTGVEIGTFKFRASNEDVNLTKVGLVLSTSTPSDLQTVYLYANGAQIGTATFTGVTTTATSTLNSALKLTKDTDVLITIKADLQNIGSSYTGTEGRLVKIDVTNAEGSGLSSGSTLQVGGVTAGVNGVRMFKSFPTVASDSSLASTGVSDGKLMRFKITADSKGPVGIYQLQLTVATSSFATGGGVSSVKIMVYSDSGYSSAVSGTYGDATGQFGSTNGETGGTTLTSNPTIDFRAVTNALQIPAGTTYYFEVESTVASTQTGTSVTTTLNGDAAYIAAAHLGAYFVSTTTGAIADDNNDFIWSGNATTTAIFNANDWANGYGILGLPSGGLSKTRSN